MFACVGTPVHHDSIIHPLGIFGRVYSDDRSHDCFSWPREVFPPHGRAHEPRERFEFLNIPFFSFPIIYSKAATVDRPKNPAPKTDRGRCDTMGTWNANVYGRLLRISTVGARGREKNSTPVVIGGRNTG